MRLLERDGALDTLGGLLAEPGGSGRVALISGEAGIGKSALVAQFALRTSRAARILWGECEALATPRALGPLHDIGRQAGGPLAARLAAGDAREAVFDALLAELEGPAPTVLVLEDVHWADEATLDMIMFLGRRIARTSALLVLTFRDDERSTRQSLLAVLSALPRHVVCRVPLAPLSVAAVTELAGPASLPGPAAVEVYDATGGNPLLVTEVLAAGALRVPATARDLMTARMAALPPQARAAARLVSVVPGHAENVLLAGSADAVEACLTGGVLVASDAGLAFRHELLRQAVLAAIPPEQVVALHATVLAALEAAGADPARMAHHAHHAGDVAALLRHGPAAARRAAAVNAHREAAGHLRFVLPHIERLPGAEQAALLQFFAVEAYLAGAAAEGLPAARRAYAGWSELGDVERASGALLWIGQLAWWTGHIDECRDAYARAVDELSALPPTRTLGRAYGYRALRSMQEDDPDAAIGWGERAIALAGRFDDLRTVIHGRMTVAATRFLHRDAGGAELEEVHLAAWDAGLVQDAALALSYLATMSIERNELDAAAGYMDRALTFAEEHDLIATIKYLLGQRARIRLERGEWAEAGADAERSIGWPGPAGSMRVHALVVLGLLQARTGDPTAALTSLDRAAADAYGIGELHWIGAVAAARAEYFWLYGEPDRAVAEAGRWLPLAVERGHRWFAGALAHRMWRAGAAAPPSPDFDRPHRLLIEGDWAAAAADWERRGCHYSRAEALVCGDEAAAAEAVRIADELGATKVAQVWRAELRERGLRVPRRPRRTTVANPAGLTARQVEVVALVAEGLTNAQIAARLSMSTKTVSNHLAAVMVKLGATTRGQAAATARRLGIVAAPARSG